MHYLHDSSVSITASSVEVRCLVDDVAAGYEHEHAGVELILNLGNMLGSVVWRNSAGEAQMATIEANHCCLIPAGVRHFINGLRTYGLVSLLVRSVEQPTS